MRLHGYWRSTASYRVRIALGLKGIAYEQVTHDLRTGMQGAAEYAAINPQHLVPTLDTGEGMLVQSPAILEWLEETHPLPPLLPTEPLDRAIVRGMADIVACDIHPLNNLRVLQVLRGELQADEAQVAAWIARWIQQGFAAIDAMVARHGAGFAFGSTPTIADCCLIPQVYSARRFDVDLTAYPHIAAVADRAATVPAFADAHPDRQPDAD